MKATMMLSYSEKRKSIYENLFKAYRGLRVKSNTCASEMSQKYMSHHFHIMKSLKYHIKDILSNSSKFYFTRSAAVIKINKRINTKKSLFVIWESMYS